MTHPTIIRRTGRRLLLAAFVLAVLIIPSAQATPGALDPSFGAGGKVTTSTVPGDDYPSSLVRQPDGKLVAAGISNNGSNVDIQLVRYNPNGSLDTSFNGTGKVTTAIGSADDEAWALVRQPDGKLVVAGDTYNGSVYELALVRYNPDGSLDTTFNGTGKVTTPFGDGGANALLVQPDGKLVAAGASNTGSNYDAAVARYNPDGSLDTSFNGTGIVTTAIGSGTDSVNALALQPDGKLVAAGYTSNGTNNDLALIRYNPDGSLDTSFNGTGKVTTTFGTDSDVANALLRQADGKLVVAAHANKDFALARYNPDGSLDTTFNGTGKVTTALGPSDDGAYALALRPDGKLVAAGYTYSTSYDFALVRYNPNGSLDSTFNGTGKVTTAVGSGKDIGVALVLQPDGKPVVAGSTSEGSADDNFAIVRYRDNSTLSVARTGSGSGSVTSSPAGISCGATCSAPFSTVPVTLTATPSPGSSFLGWSGACSGSGTCKLTLASDRTVTARFEPDKTLTLTKAGTGLGEVSSGPAGISCGTTCAHAFRYGALVTLTAAPSERSLFAGWSGACSGTATCTVAMSAARSVTASFTALCVAPTVKGKTLLAAKRALTKAHCALGKVTKAFSAKVRKGRVISERPRAGTKLAPGSKLKLSLSKGKRP